jgi:hypothetical protein
MECGANVRANRGAVGNSQDQILYHLEMIAEYTTKENERLGLFLVDFSQLIS